MPSSVLLQHCVVNVYEDFVLVTSRGEVAADLFTVVAFGGFGGQALPVGHGELLNPSMLCNLIIIL